MKLGKAFSDSVIIGQKSQMRISSDNERSWWLGMGRILMFVTGLAIAFFILAWRLFYLTVVEGHYYRVLADGNRTRELVRHAPRGLLLDRTGKPLVSNIPYYRLLKPCASQASDCVTPLSRQAGDALSEKGLPAGTFLEVDYRREYLYPDAMSHVVGYTGELSQEELNDAYYKLRSYGGGDRVGRTGVEAVYEDRLRGRNGKELVEVDAYGAIVRTLGRDRETPGEDITLSIDAGLQQVVAQNFPAGEKGAVVVSKPATGELLALYSSPSFDMNEFSTGLSQKEYDDLVNSPDQPMFDRAIGGVYPPGSTFKIVLAIASLEEGAINKDTTVDDVGILKIGPFSFSNWYFTQYGKTDGLVNIVKALQRSNDIFFYKVGEMLGITKLSAWAHKLGLGNVLGIELAGEASGLMPDPAWKKQQFTSPADRAQHNDEWYLGDTYHVAIGQGYLLVTPLQVNAWTDTIANNGILCRPTILKVSGGLFPGKKNSCHDVGISKDTLNLVTQGLYEACQTGGTGWPLFGFTVHRSSFTEKQQASSSALPSTMNNEQSTIAVPVACKTGTAEFGDPKNRTHAWFTAFAPLRQDFVGQAPVSDKQPVISGDPEIAVTVLVEGAGEGSSVAAPIAKKILEAWFGR